VSRPRRVYDTPAYRLARKLCLARDGYRCQIGLKGCRGRATCADHVVELEAGGHPYELSNLQAACASCNTAKRNQRKSREAKGEQGWFTEGNEWWN
jgi:5-methylcytosine-specific restriction endonuclease McrA